MVAGQQDKQRSNDDLGVKARPRPDAMAPFVVPVRRTLALRLRAEDAYAALAELLSEEADLGRFFLWFAVAVVAGVGVYFALPREPQLWALASAVVAAAVFARRARTRPALYVVLSALVAVLAGTTLAKVRTDLVAAPVLDRERTASFSGVIEVAEGGEGGMRLIVRIAKLDDKVPRSAWPERIRLSVRKPTPYLVPGAAIEGLARLRPPQGPVFPGGYDFARANYFDGIGATGFSYGTPKAMATAPGPTARETLRRGVEGFRRAVAGRIRETLDGEAGEVATALIIGDRRGIGEATVEALRKAGLAHILAISGLHMALVTGVVFAAIRAMFAFSAGLATARPIRKWAAGAALATGAAYLILSGAGIATQRAFVMAVVVLVAVLLDRPALTMRSVALAALAVIAVAPEAVAGPSFQMSFAAVVALVAAYESFAGRKARRPTNSGRGAVIGGRLGRYFVGLALTSLIAGLATAPIAAFHFYRVAPFGLIANLLAMPIVATIIMPAGVLAMLAAPFGLDPLVFPVMGAGIDAVVAIASEVANWTPHGGVTGRLPVAAILLMTLALVWVSLWRTRLRYAAVVPLVMGMSALPFGARPDVLISADGETAAVRGIDGRLIVAAGKGSTFTVENWLRAEGDTRAVDDASLMRGAACDPLGCILPLAGLTKSAQGHARDPDPPAKAASAIGLPRIPPQTVARETAGPIAQPPEAQQPDSQSSEAQWSGVEPLEPETPDSRNPETLPPRTPPPEASTTKTTASPPASEQPEQAGDQQVVARIALVRDPLAFREDCRRADVVVASISAPAFCAETAMVIDAAMLQRTGAIALYRRDGQPGVGTKAGFAVVPAKPRFARPWHHGAPETAPAVAQ